MSHVMKAFAASTALALVASVSSGVLAQDAEATAAELNAQQLAAFQASAESNPISEGDIDSATDDATDESANSLGESGDAVEKATEKGKDATEEAIDEIEDKAKQSNEDLDNWTEDGVDDAADDASDAIDESRDLEELPHPNEPIEDGDDIDPPDDPL